ncbi:heme o synthase [Sneathiella sp. CAU 1612]|uniref:Protoheme IX farnesyltransferase n=1 Tax=Sneathiella sedimenti TaxID=2816034 RepID=A0ABS3F1A3_9PROT|nr:heme o synthase [Sneathiella sedimenti]
MSDTSLVKETIETRVTSDLTRVSDYFALLKPRVMSLVVFTGLVGLAVAPGSLHPVLAFTALLCIAVGAGASGAINMWYDADIDAIMDRTKDRPIPAGRVSANEALAFGTVLSVASVVLMGLAVNYVAAALLALTIGFYVFVYSMWLKRRTPQNIVIGGAAGAFPPMIGWAAVTGDVSAESLVLFAIIFMWTPPHFWALSLWRDIDYAKAGVPMLPVVAGRDVTRRQIVLYSALLFPVAVMPYFLGYAGIFYGVGSGVLSGLFLLLSLKVWRCKDEESAKQLFAYSLLYLFLLFAILLGESLVRTVI